GSLYREDSARRSIYPGAQYAPLDVPEKLPPVALENRFAGMADPDDPLALSRAIHAHYAPRAARQELREAREDLLQALQREHDRCERRLANVRRELARASRAQSWRRKGELLKLALPHIERGQAEVTVEDVFEPDRPEVTIELDPALSPTANLERMFEKYRKALAGGEELQRREERTRATLARLEALGAEVEEADSPEHVAELRSKARSAGLLRPPRKPAERAGRRKGPRRFVSADGLEILVARNQRQNDRLTFTLANGNDYWLHVRGWPGPHVVLRHGPDGGAPQESLLDAAHLAVRFSKIRGTDYAEVAYTRCKHVRRLKGAPAGKVSYANESTMQVRIEPARIERLLSGDGVDEGAEL
ncbi:MAG: NFACT RNA binding domain-containing protein, partial [Candidatus Brocadiia bacterium]